MSRTENPYLVYSIAANTATPNKNLQLIIPAHTEANNVSFDASFDDIVEDPDLTKTKNQRARYLPAPNRNGKVFVTCSVNGRYGIYPVWWIYNAKKNVFELCCLKRGRNYKLDALIIIKWE